MSSAVFAYEMRALSFKWASHNQALFEIPHLNIQSAESILILGESGSGKSSLLGLMAGIHDTWQGQLTVLGQDFSTMKRSLRDQFRAAHIGYVFQQFNLLPYLSILDNVMLSAEMAISRAHRARSRSGSVVNEARRLLSDLGLGEASFLQKSPLTLSVGQQQRVAVARALLGAPEILIADEPTSALDAGWRDEFMALLHRECRALQTTLIVVSHDPALRPYFDRSLSLDAGQLREAF